MKTYTVNISNNDNGDPLSCVLVDRTRPEKGLNDLLDLHNITMISWVDSYPMLQDVRAIKASEFYISLTVDETAN